jgi:ribonucleoside-diphosphate reductase beta chain
MSIDMPIEDASVSQLQQVPIDRVMSIIDEGLVHLPSYRELYYRWERQQWMTQDIDFSTDRQQWQAMNEEEKRMRLGGLSAFFKGEECVTNTLAPYAVAMPTDEMRIFLTTQLVDEARHTVFFERFFTEALGINYGHLEATLGVVEKNMNPKTHYLLVDALNDVSDRIRRNPSSMADLIEGVVLYHIIIEGTLALAGQRSILEAYRQMNIFPAFRGGFTAVARDESRHVVFGVKVLRDMIQQDAANAHTVYAAVNKYAPTAIEGLTPIPEGIQMMLEQKMDPWQTPRYGAESLRKKLKVIGISMEIPSVPPPPTF